MLKGAFQHRSGRVISLGRAVLAAVFLFAIWIDPSQPSRHHSETYLLLAVYLAAAIAYLAFTWSDWWLEARLSGAALAADVILFGLIVFLTEGYTSPFFAFSVFVVLSAMIKWGWRETAATAAAVILLYIAAGVGAMSGAGEEFDLTRFLFRGAYLTVVSAVLIWFGLNLAEGRGAPRAAEYDEEEAGRLPVVPALVQARAATGAGRALLAWWEREEPWIEVAALAPDGRIAQHRHGFAEFPTLVAAKLDGRAFLFDARRRRVLLRQKRHPRALVLTDDPVDPAFASRYGLAGGLAVPVDAAGHCGILFVTDVPGLCSDDLAIGERIGAGVSAAFDRATRVALARETAATRTRLSLARDLHDSVVQLLAGIAFRLEGMRKSSAAGRDIGAEVDALQRELAAEQRELRAFISDLRGSDREPPCDLGASLPDLLARLERQWGVECALEATPANMPGSPQLEYEIHQLVREGVANAVRHGGATRIEVSLEAAADALSLVIADNGSGFPEPDDAGGGGVRPRSLDERVRELRGRLALRTGAEGSRLTISLPSEGAVSCAF